MPSVRTTFLALAASLALGSFFLLKTTFHFKDPYPLMTASLNSSETNLQDVGGVAFGFRRLAADLAWIQTLQYYGTPEAGQSEFEFENGMGIYPRFLSLCKHVAGIDPYFTYVYYFGGGILGWNLNRLEEAEELLKMGIANNPREWRLPQYLAGLAYQKNHDVTNLIRFLESVAQDPECPLMMKALLANIYKKQQLYDKALHMWGIIYASNDPDYTHRAIEQVQAIQKLRQAPKQPRS